MANEIVAGGKSTYKSDIFSLGMVLSELITGDAPFADLANDVAIGFAIDKGDRSPLPDATDASTTAGKAMSARWKAELSAQEHQRRLPRRSDAWMDDNVRVRRGEA